MKKIFLLYLMIGSTAIASDKTFQIEQVEQHSTAKDCWIVIKDKVYDISSYITKHPAPEIALTKYCGKVADKGWNTKDKSSPHSRAAKRLLDRYEVGTLTK